MSKRDKDGVPVPEPRFKPTTVRDRLGEAQEQKELEITSRGLGMHPVIRSNAQPAFGAGVQTQQVRQVQDGRYISGPTGDPVVDFYLALCDTQLSESRHNEEEPHRMLAAASWYSLKQAAIIRIPGELYGTFYNLADRYTTEQTGATWHGQDEPPVPQHMSAKQFYTAVEEMGKHLPLPDKRPFDYLFFGYEPKIKVHQDLAPLYGLHQAKEQGVLRRFTIGGHLVAPDSVMACIQLELYIEGKLVGGTSMMMERHHRRELGRSEWHAPYTLAPWIIPSLIEWVNEHKTVVEDTRGLSYRLKVKKWAKQHKLKKMPPPPYYTVRMQDTKIQETAKEGFASRYKETREYEHRWTVRGHYMVRVKRGPLPLTADLEATLRKRKYKLFINNGPDMKTWQHLRHRGVEPKRVDEWMAVLVSWRKDYVKGPEDKPLIPSVRTSGRKRERRSQEGADEFQGGT